MKLRLVLLSILFAISTTFAAIHEVEHIAHDDSSTCLVCTVNHNLVSADAVNIVFEAEKFHFEAVTKESLFSYLHVKINSNRTRAPPKLS